MGTTATIAFNNIYYQARLTASMSDERFKSRERAAEVMNVSVDCLNNYELGYAKSIPPDKIAMMAQAYHAPHLLNYYCACECPIGKARGMQMVSTRRIEQTAFSFMQALRNVQETQEKLIDVVADGEVTPDELPILNDVVLELKKYASLYEELKIVIEKVELTNESDKGHYP